MLASAMEGDRQTQYKLESIYDNYLSPELPRHSMAPSTMSSMTGADNHFSLAPPLPRSGAGRNTAFSMADTASIYSTNGGPGAAAGSASGAGSTAGYERWSLEQGLAGMESGSSADVYARGRASTGRPSIPSTDGGPAGSEIFNGLSHGNAHGYVERSSSRNLGAPYRADVPIATSASPAPSHYTRKHFSRPL